MQNLVIECLALEITIWIIAAGLIVGTVYLFSLAATLLGGSPAVLRKARAFSMCFIGVLLAGYLTVFGHEPESISAELEKLSAAVRQNNYEASAIGFTEEVVIVYLKDSENQRVGGILMKRESLNFFIEASCNNKFRQPLDDSSEISD